MTRIAFAALSCESDVLVLHPSMTSFEVGDLISLHLFDVADVFTWYINASRFRWSNLRISESDCMLIKCETDCLRPARRWCTVRARKSVGVTKYRTLRNSVQLKAIALCGNAKNEVENLMWENVWNAQIVFCASSVSKRVAIIDWLAATHFFVYVLCYLQYFSPGSEA